MKKRFMIDIKLNGSHEIQFFYDDTYFLNTFSSNDIEAIGYWNGVIHFYPCNNNTVPHVFNATEEDFSELKKVISTSPDFVCCGDSYIFALDNVVTFAKGHKNNYLTVDCRNDYYTLKAKTKEDLKDFIMAMQRKWQNTFTEWDQNRDSAVSEEDTLSR